MRMRKPKTSPFSSYFEQAVADVNGQAGRFLGRPQEEAMQVAPSTQYPLSTRKGSSMLSNYTQVPVALCRQGRQTKCAFKI